MQSLWIHQSRPRPSWYELDRSSQAELRARWGELDTEAVAGGAERVGEYTIRGQSDYATLEVWKFASPEESFAFWSDRVAAEYSTWFTSSNQLGTSLDSETPQQVG